MTEKRIIPLPLGVEDGGGGVKTQVQFLKMAKSWVENVILHCSCLYIRTSNMMMWGICSTNVVWSIFSKIAKFVKIWWKLLSYSNYKWGAFSKVFQKCTFLTRYWSFTLRLPFHLHWQSEDVWNMLIKSSLNYFFQNFQVCQDLMLSFRVIPLESQVLCKIKAYFLPIFHHIVILWWLDPKWVIIFFPHLAKSRG